MPVHEWSIKAYNEMRDSGALKGQRLLVAGWFAHQYPEPRSGGDAVEALVPPHARRTSQLRSRVTELKELGVLVEVGSQESPATGATEATYLFTGKFPAKPDKVKLPSRKELMEKIETLEAEVAMLRARLDKQQLELF